MPAITGGIVVTQTRILMPVDVATIRSQAAFPVTGTIVPLYGTTVVSTVSVVTTVTAVNVVGTLRTSGTLPVVITNPIMPITYTEIIEELDPEIEYISPSVDSLYYPGGIGFSISYLSDQGDVATVLIENSSDNDLFRPVATITLIAPSQYDAVFPPTRRFMRFTAISYAPVVATIDAVISQLPSK